jgi:hypothetical protein
MKTILIDALSFAAFSLAAYQDDSLRASGVCTGIAISMLVAWAEAHAVGQSSHD